MLSDIWNDLNRKNFRILMFHSIARDSSYRFAVSPDSFKRMMEYLAESSYRVLPLRRALSEEGGKTVVITFDDGYLDNLEEAAPILAELGLEASFFVSTDLVGKTNQWDRVHPPLAVMDWEALRQLVEMGHEIGAHTATHKNLEKVTDEESLEYEIDRPLHILRDKLGVEEIPLAYPYGQQNQTVRARARNAGYYAGVIAGGFWGNHPGVNPFLLRREGITASTNLADFRAMVQGAVSIGYWRLGYRYFQKIPKKV